MCLILYICYFKIDADKNCLIEEGTNTRQNKCLKYNDNNYIWKQTQELYRCKKESKNKIIFDAFIKLYDDNEPYIITNYWQGT